MNEIYKLITLSNLQYFYEKLQTENKLFIGNKEEYNTANEAGQIAVGTLVIITDDVNIGGITNNSESSPILGVGKLGYLKLG